jgi:hypothetical protein
MSREKKLPDEAKILMVKSLAASQTPWRPIRNDQQSAGSIWLYRQLPTLRLGGGRASRREAASHWKAELVSRRLMLASGRLTPRGKQLARSWTWPFFPSELRLAVRRLREAVKRDDVHEDMPDGLAFVPEEIICGQYWGQQNALLQNCFLPWLTDGVLVCEREAGSGCAFYAVADPAVNLSRLASKVIDEREDFSEELADFYREETNRVHTDMLGYDARGEIGPAGLAMVELKSKRDYLAPGELEKIKPIFTVSDG